LEPTRDDKIFCRGSSDQGIPFLPLVLADILADISAACSSVKTLAKVACLNFSLCSSDTGNDP
jgi:hypothetical protein